ncbi:MAG: transcription-repair coupling factor [Bacteroidetes bacterium]|nr:transcription-repair coupling factor [Bacteroidota bacterium]
MLKNSSFSSIFSSQIASLNLNEKWQLKGLAGSALSFFIARLYIKHHKNFLIIASDKEKAAYILNDLEQLLPYANCLFFPETYKNPYQIERTTNANIQERTETLNFISRTDKNYVVVTYPHALSEKVTLKQKLHQNTLQIKVTEKLSVDFISEFLQSYNFNMVDFVYEPGQYAIRGGIIDIYSYANELPYRIELFGNEINSIKSFEPATQLSDKNYDYVTIIPNTNSSLFNEEKVLFLNYFDAQQSLIFIDDVEYTAATCDKKFEKALVEYNNYAGEIAQLEPQKLFTTSHEIKEALEKQICFFYGNSQAGSNKIIFFQQKPQPSFNKNFDLLISHLKENKTKGFKNYFLTDNSKQASRLTNIFNDLLAKEHRSFESIIEHVNLNIHEGFIDDESKIAIFTDHQLFERYHRFKLKESKYKNNDAFSLKEVLMLNPGDYVTHIDHGIGRFAGLQKITQNGKIQECVKLLFKDNDMLYVSIHSLHRISKYSGKEGQVPRIDKLGSSTWQTLKQKTKSKVKQIAYDLIKLYAERKTRPGHAFLPDNYLQHELEASFIYEDTPDQIKVTADVKRDMQKPTPMDRLVCGDVGFGKTEVAIRAAFKAVCDSKQVAILVPTTILAYQHYKTFKNRLVNLPCTVDYISRFVTAAKQKETIKKLSEGKIDIIIGTHKLVGKEIKFKNLGLLIIDEEQKFGVGVKDKLKTFKANIDTLTLTATPIPRTLQFSLMGARDLSVINTPPPNRYPVQTELHTFSEELIRDAIANELNRGGQVFFVHNKVSDIAEIAGMIQRLVPDARIAIGHGQMDGDKLEDVMLGFMEGDYDVLVATTIIESGLDISNANTIIINQAQNFGLSDLHQMRGRVGRSNRKAFCYLLAPPAIALTDEARKRLKAIVDYSDLGSGFQIAMRDLDIRGAGDLLGGEQSGFINDMGFDTYMKILNEAISELKDEDWYINSIGENNNDASKATFSRQFVKETIVETDLPLLLPELYVSSLTERLILYRELDNITKVDELANFEKNLRDRFGPLPTEAIELISLVKMRWQAMRIGFEKITLKNGKMLTYFISKSDSEYFNSTQFKAVLNYAQNYPHLCKLKEQNNRLWLNIDEVNSIQKVIEIFNTIEQTVSI